MTVGHLIVQRLWTELGSILSINVLELQAIHLALRHLWLKAGGRNEDHSPLLDFSVPELDRCELGFWLNDESFESEGNASQNTQFENILDTGKPCQHYIYNDGVPFGCHVKFDKQPSPNSEFMMVVTDRSKTIRPFIKHLELSEIYTPPPPCISSVSRTHSQSINISWEISHNVKKLEPTTFQVEVNRTDGENLSTMEWSGRFKEVLNVLPDVGYTVRVRVKQKYGRWSEWSKEETLPGKEPFGTTYMVLLLLIPLLITVSTIVLLIYLKRLQVIVFPPIPDPGKVFKNRFGDPNDWQQWIKYNKVNTCNKPAKEEICSVILVETPLSSSQVE
ncbi:interleukin-13 receptor subunit alpha-1-like [Rhinophrynus dorsalis]